jgi:peptidoglycan/LPS O-acetylase OafA/YrhL
MRRFPELDGLRGLLALLVIAVHARMRGFDWLIVLMDGFFALSAFLITLGLLEDRSPTQAAILKRFYLRRTARIFPAYYALLIVVAALILGIDLLGPLLGMTGHIGLSELRPYFVYLQFTDLIGHHDESTAFLGSVRYLRHTWSLAVEEQFYLVWGLLFCFAARGGLRALAAMALVAAGVAARHSGMVDSPLILYHLDAFGYGALGALAYQGLAQQGDRPTQERRGRVWGYAGTFALLACWTLIGVPQDFLHYLRYGAEPASAQPESVWSPATILSAFGCGAIVFALACASGARPLALLRLGALRYVGRISYCLYLFHYPIVDLLLRHQHQLLHLGSYGNLAAVAALSIGTAHVATRFFDRLNHAIVQRATAAPAVAEVRAGEPPASCESFRSAAERTLPAPRL